MKIKCAKSNISEEDFLRLLIASIITKTNNPIIRHHQLEKDLYQFYDNPNYHFLFEDVQKIEHLDGNNYLNLNAAFQTALVGGIIYSIKDSGALKYVINLTNDEANEIISQFETSQVKAMNELVSKI